MSDVQSYSYDESAIDDYTGAEVTVYIHVTVPYGFDLTPGALQDECQRAIVRVMEQGVYEVDARDSD